jgi:hypothetical protein
MVGDGTYERRIHSAKILEGASPDAPNFSAVQEHCPPKLFANHQSLFAVHCSLLAICYSLPF